MACPLCEDERFVCEKHPEKPWPHDDCAGPGIPCPACQDPDERPELPGVGAASRQLKIPPTEHAARLCVEPPTSLVVELRNETTSESTFTRRARLAGVDSLTDRTAVESLTASL